MASPGGDGVPPMDTTSSSTPILEPNMPFDSNAPSALSKLNVFVIVVPVLLATGIVIWGTLVLLGIIQRRRHLRSVYAWSSTSGGGKAGVSLLKKPVLLDVRLPYTSHASSTERIHPISVEVLKSSSTRSAPKGHKHRCFTQMKEHQKRRRQTAIATETDVPPKSAQITVLIAMPTANRNHSNKWDNCDLGTRRVLYKDRDFEPQDDEEFELEEKTGYHISHREHHHTDSLSYYIF